MLKFELSEQHVAIIGRALGQLPHDAVRATIDEMQKQIDAQRQNKDEQKKEAA